MRELAFARPRRRARNYTLSRGWGRGGNGADSVRSGAQDFQRARALLAGGSDTGCVDGKLMVTEFDDIALFGGIAGAALAVEEFEVCRGLVLRRTYAHLMSPYILASDRPERPGEHHPGPWKAAHGGVWLHVEIEVALSRGVRTSAQGTVLFGVAFDAVSRREAVLRAQWEVPPLGSCGAHGPSLWCSARRGLKCSRSPSTLRRVVRAGPVAGLERYSSKGGLGTRRGPF